MTSNKWSLLEIEKFLDIFENYPSLWDITCKNYCNRNKKEGDLQNLFNELKSGGLDAINIEILKSKIKNIRDSYRREVMKVEKSKKSGAGEEDIYLPLLGWYNKANYLHRVSITRNTSSNMVRKNFFFIFLLNRQYFCYHNFFLIANIIH
jgi:hypothetical protein